MENRKSQKAKMKGKEKGRKAQTEVEDAERVQDQSLEGVETRPKAVDFFTSIFDGQSSEDDSEVNMDVDVEEEPLKKVGSKKGRVKLFVRDSLKVQKNEEHLAAAVDANLGEDDDGEDVAEEEEEDIGDEDDEEEEEGDVGDEEEEDESQQRTAIREELSNLTYQELEELKQKMGLTLYNEAMFGTNSKKKLTRKKQMKLFKRENKNRPRELSSRVRVPKVREVIHVKKVVKKDPRFDDSCGELKKEVWDKNYEFLRDIQTKEVADLKKQVKGEKDLTKRAEMRQHIQKFENKEKSRLVKEKETLKEKQQKEENRKRVAEGKKPFYVKKSTKKLMDLAEKYEELKASGGLDKYLKKKRKKNQSRDRKNVVTN